MIGKASLLVICRPSSVDAVLTPLKVVSWLTIPSSMAPAWDVALSLLWQWQPCGTVQELGPPCLAIPETEWQSGTLSIASSPARVHKLSLCEMTGRSNEVWCANLGFACSTDVRVMMNGARTGEQTKSQTEQGRWRTVRDHFVNFYQDCLTMMTTCCLWRFCL
jgi:hypothetical protein